MHLTELMDDGIFKKVVCFHQAHFNEYPLSVIVFYIFPIFCFLCSRYLCKCRLKHINNYDLGLIYLSSVLEQKEVKAID